MMPSPFPGMDPYLEQKWTNVHSRLITYICDAINPGLPDDLVAGMEETVTVESDEGEHWAWVPDVHVARDPEAAFEVGGSSRGGGVAVAEPVMVRVVGDPWRQKRITITDTRGGRLVTIIELLSPSNKRGKGMVEYKKKRDEIPWGSVNLVEIDLCRRGDWERLLWPHTLPPRAKTTYRIITRRAQWPGQLEVYPISLRQRLPAFPIPLRPDDPDLPLDLQPLLDRAYDNGRFGRTLAYDEPLVPPLEGEDAAWAAELLRPFSVGTRA